MLEKFDAAKIAEVDSLPHADIPVDIKDKVIVTIVSANACNLR